VFPREGRIAPVASSPTVYGNVVYVAADDGVLYALHATGPAAGSLLPNFPIPLDGAVKGRPAVYGNLGRERVYVATVAGTLYAFNLDGTPAWNGPQRVCPGVPIVSTPAVRGNYVYVTATNGRIIRRNAVDGSPAGGLTYGRVVQTTLSGRQSPPPAQAYLEVADARGLFSAGRIVVERSDISQRLEFTYSGVNTAVRPHRLLNVVPVGSGTPQLALPAGSRVIGYGPGASASASPAVPGQEDSTLVIAALDNDMSASRPGFGRNLIALKSEPYGLVPQWEATYGARITAAPTVDHNTGDLFIATWNAAASPSRGGRLYCLHASNGQPAWTGDGSIALNGGILRAGPWLDRVQRVLYFGTTDGRLYGVNMADGSPAFRPTPLDGRAASFEATPLVVGGLVYIGSHSGRLYAVPWDHPEAYAVFASPVAASFDGSPSASGSTPGKDVIVVGSSAGQILAFPIL
jgi:outer membrane protein assembly factor BamB